MNKVLKIGGTLLFMLLGWQLQAFSKDIGQIRGRLLLDDSWEREVYLSLVESFEREFSFSNSLIVGSSMMDSLGNFEIILDNASVDWSLLRLHVVKRGFSPKYLVMGSREENYLLLIAKQDSQIAIHNTGNLPIFEDIKIEGAPYMETFDYIRKLSEYPNAIDYDNSLVEKEFIEDVVSEKLKMVADTCQNPLVSLYALYKTDFRGDFLKNPTFYEQYLAKRKGEHNPYFESFRRQFPNSSKFPWLNIFVISIVGILISAGLYLITKKKKPKLNLLSVQERKILELLQQGMSNQEISNVCSIETSTTKSHVSSIYSKLNIKSRKEALNIKVK